jgi:hypothetical protein
MDLALYLLNFINEINDGGGNSAWWLKIATGVGVTALSLSLSLAVHLIIPQLTNMFVIVKALSRVRTHISLSSDLFGLINAESLVDLSNEKESESREWF